MPDIPSRTGYTSKWDEQILSTKITEFKIFVPIYEVITFKVTFLDAKNGNEIATRTVEYGSFALVPEFELYRLGDKLYGFTGWKTATTDEFVENIDGNKLTKVYSNLTVYAVYEESIEQPVLAVHFDGTTVTMSLCLPDGSSLCVLCCVFLYVCIMLTKTRFIVRRCGTRSVRTKKGKITVLVSHMDLCIRI